MKQKIAGSNNRKETKPTESIQKVPADGTEKWKTAWEIALYIGMNQTYEPEEILRVP